MRSPASRAHSRPPRFLAALFLALSHFSLADVTVSSLAGGGADGTSFGTVDGAGTSVGFYQPNGIALHGDGNLSIADTGNYKIRALSPRGIVTTIAGGGADGESKGVADGFGTSAGFNLPAAVVADPAGLAGLVEREDIPRLVAALVRVRLEHDVDDLRAATRS